MSNAFNITISIIYNQFVLVIIISLRLFIYLENTAYMKSVVFAVVLVLMISRNYLKTLAFG